MYDRGSTLEYAVIRNAQGEVVIYPAVATYKVSEKTVYGKRYGHSDFEVYYFICDYDSDCTDHQSYAYEDFRRILEARGLDGFKEITQFKLYHGGYVY